MKERLIFLFACMLVILLIVGNRQAKIRSNVMSDIAYQRNTDYQIAQVTNDYNDLQTVTYASETPPTVAKKYYDVPLSAEWQEFVINACRDLDPRLVFAVMKVESDFDFSAVNGNCKGIMQINVPKHKDRMARLGVNDIMSPYDNILTGIDVLSEHIGKYGVHRGLIAYSCGEYSDTFKKYSSTRYSRKVVKYMEELD